MNLSPNKILLCILALLSLGCIYVIATSSNPTRFKDVGPFQYLDKDAYAYNPYFAKDIYIAPGQARLAHNINTKKYDNSYLPYESSIPAVDVLRANNQILPPSYYTQVIHHNLMP